MHDPGRLSKPARQAIEQAQADDGMRVSTISVWEVAVKVGLGKLSIPLEITEWFKRASRYPNIVIEPLSAVDAIGSTLLPGTFHRDPADRIIVALARRYGAPLVTSDQRIHEYAPVVTLW